MINKLIQILLVQLLIILPLQSENDIYFSKIGIEQGLSQLSVMTIYQDELGVMWFGTREGVNRYNGNMIEVIRPIPNDSGSLHGSLVKHICGNRNGSVFIHSQNGVNEYRLRTGEMRSIQRDYTDAINYGIRNLWIAEGHKLFAYADGVKRLHLVLPDEDMVIRTILETSDQRIFLGTLSSGVYVADPNKKIRKVISNTSQVSEIFEDALKNVWVGTWQEGLYRIDRSGVVRNYRPDATGSNSLSSHFVRAITQDNRDYLWIGTRRGLDRLTIQTGEFKHYASGADKYKQLSNESVWSLYKDTQGTIWAGTYFGGVNYFNPEVDFYTFHDLQAGFFMNQAFPVISDIIEDQQRRLFLCTEGNGLIQYDPVRRTYRNFTAQPGNPNSLTADNIKVGYFDKEANELWLGTHLGGITRYNLNTGRFTGIPKLHPDWDQSDIVRAFIPYGDKMIVGTYNGIFTVDKRTGAIALLSETLHDEVSYAVDLKLVDDYLWIASRGIYRYHLPTGKVTSYFWEKDNPMSLSNNNVMKLMLDSKNRLWIGTNGGGVNLYDVVNDQFIHFTVAGNGLINDYISNLMESPFGYIFIATTKGLSVLDPDSKTISNYSTENGFPLNSLFNGGMRTLLSGELFIAGMNGMVSFYEEHLSIPKRMFNIHFVNLHINNEKVFPGDESGVLALALPFTKSIRLNHRHTMITLEVASNNYIAVNQPIYRYKLDGFNSAWTLLPGGINTLNFMNLNPGRYTLVVEALSAVDMSVVATTQLGITMLPPFYQSWYAYLFYIAFISFVVWRYIVFSRSKLLLKASLAYEKKEKEHIESVNQSKLRFFTNISHEFRTPLTLIGGQVDMLMQMQNIAPSVYNRILNIKRNTLNMQTLINELLEFRKTEQGHLQLKVVEQDIVAFVYEVFLSFSEYANYRSIKFNFDTKEDRVMIWFDPIQMQKVLYNLISNAFKYTPKNGSITLYLLQSADNVTISIADTGIGMETDALVKIFDRFYQAENGLEINSMNPGTGIGLALSKSIVEAHHADIQVESTKDVGSVFKIILKKGSSHFAEDQKIKLSSADELCMNCVEELDSAFLQEVIEAQPKGQHPYSMLIVEDNEDLRLLLKQIFEPIYKIHTAANGEEGLEMTIEHQPDIVLSDLMMPLMSGSEMCSRIKNNFLVCHIPVVLLTAQTAVEYNLEGLRLGADDYITKPFNVKTLITRCNNLVNNRRVLQEKFSKQVDVSSRLVATNQLDQEFMEKAIRVVEEHLDDSEFDVPAFSREMALGRTKLFTKIKGITGQTPNDFILNVRLKKAATLLNNHPEYNISDVTYMLGFSSPKYFTKCFKDHFGTTPSEFRKSEVIEEFEAVDE